MSRIITIYEFNEEKHPNIAKKFPDMKYHDALLYNKWQDLDSAIYNIRKESRNKRAKVLIIKLRKKEGKIKTVFRRKDYDRNLY